jgi:hypothetical protein
MLARMSSAEFVEWQAYAAVQHEHWRHETDDGKKGQLVEYW